jgi:hypothetical protein
MRSDLILNLLQQHREKLFRTAILVASRVVLVARQHQLLELRQASDSGLKHKVLVSRSPNVKVPQSI